MTISEQVGGQGSGPPKRRLGLTVAFLAALVVLIGLGVWQLQRLQWKRELLADMAAARAAPAVSLSTALEAVRQGRDPAQRVVTDCPRLDSSGFVELHAIHEGRLGRRWISACRIEDGPYAAILVDRGFVAEGDRPPGPVFYPEGHRPVVGYLRAPEKPGRFAPPPSVDGPGGAVWYARDIPGMSRVLGVEGAVAPVFLMLESPPPEGWGPAPMPFPPRVSNNHLGYALTWFGLAAALIGVYAALLLKGRRQ